MSVERDQLAQKLTKEDKIKFIIEQEKLANNSWKWIKEADDKTINDLYNYWTQEL
jgi:hypothetical protein|tara:strand:+ start:77 stop:241 length:165 start_codon:yes stop_codon:yes gene_type:complete